MGLEDQCRKQDPVDTAVDRVVKDMRFHNSAAAAEEVENFWMQHHGDKEWNAFINELNAREEKDPKLKALFDDFHISFTEKDGDATSLEVEYMDHGIHRDDNLNTTMLSDLMSHLPDPSDPPGRHGDIVPIPPTGHNGDIVPIPPNPYPGHLTPHNGGKETQS